MARKLAVRAYSLALRTFSPAHRDRYADEMADAFERGVAAAGARGGALGAFRFAVAALVDTVVAGLRERGRAARSRGGAGSWTAGLLPDLAHALRGLARSWAFSVVCLTSLAAGLGVALAVMMLLQLTLEPPFDLDEQGLVEVLVTEQGRLRDGWSWPDFAEVDEALPALGLIGWADAQGALRFAEDDMVESVDVTYVTPGYFRTLGIPPLMGRTFAGGESALPEGTPVVIPERLWRERLGGDPDVLDRVLYVNHSPHVVVGVAPERFPHHSHDGHRTEVWIPLSEHPGLREYGPYRLDRDVSWLRVIARLPAGTTAHRIDESLASVMSGLAATAPATNAERGARALPYAWQGARIMAEEGWVVRLLLTTVAAVLLVVVCLNLAGMFTVRGATRERELAVRLALGSSRRRLVQYLMAEAVALAVVGGLLVVGVYAACLRFLSWRFGGPIPDSVAVDGPVVAASVGAALAMTLVFGLVPALRFSRPALLSALKDESGGTRGRRSGLVHRLATSFQAGLAVPVLVVAGGVTHGALSLGGADYGVNPEGLFVTEPADLSVGGYDAHDALAFARALTEGVASLPGVTAVGVADGMPLDGVGRANRVRRPEGEGTIRVRVTRVDAGFSEALGIPLIRGRGIEEGDQAGSPPVAVVAAKLADRLFPAQDPLGRTVTLIPTDPPGPAGTPSPDSEREREYTVVGVVGDLAGANLESTKGEDFFVSFAQEPATTLALTVRGAGQGTDLEVAVRRVAAELDPALPAPEVVPFQSVIEARSRDFPVWSAFFSFVGVLLLLLSSLGVYGVVAFGVASRTREIGVRMSLGSTRRRVLTAVLGDALRLAAPGLLVGGALGLVVGRLVLNRMYAEIGLPMADTSVIVLAAVASLGVVLLASLSPARRAASVDPMVALRAE